MRSQGETEAKARYDNDASKPRRRIAAVSARGMPDKVAGGATRGTRKAEAVLYHAEGDWDAYIVT